LADNEAEMAELVNLRTARKRASRQQDEARASTNRLAHGQPKHIRELKAAQLEQAERILDQHRIEPGDGR
jgi:Domain of unknown function (DUF4169)